uniref:Integrase catalytic domain-containing protein n=1 Tax=Gongylonema pulchrum TaxID=637853 RepID=A0A183F1F1_9BILA
LLGTEHHPTVPYHHEASGQVERLVKVVIDTFAACVVNTKEEWADHLQLVAFLYNTSFNEATLRTPFLSTAEIQILLAI